MHLSKNSQIKKLKLTTGILKSIAKKNKINRKCNRTKNPIKKEELHNSIRPMKTP